MVPAPIVIDGESLGLGQFDAVARRGVSCTLALHARAKVMAGQGAVQRAVEAGDAVYGVNTGFGDLATACVSPTIGSPSSSGGSS